MLIYIHVSKKNISVPRRGRVSASHDSKSHRLTEMLTLVHDHLPL